MKEISPSKIDSLKTQINILQDSLNTIKSTNNLKSNSFDQNLDILIKVNEFYDSAWLKLVLLVGVLGVFVPFIIQYFQRLSNKQIFEKYSEDFEKKMNEIQQKNIENFEQLSKEYNQELQTIKDTLRSSNNRLIANTFFLQGRLRIRDQVYSRAIFDFIHSAKNFLSVNRIKDTNTALMHVKICLKSITDDEKDEYYELLKEKNFDWNNFLSKFNDIYFTDNIKSIKEELEKLK